LRFCFLQRAGHSSLRPASAEAVHASSAAVQPSISPIPCKTLNNLISACYPVPVLAAVHPRPFTLSFDRFFAFPTLPPVLSSRRLDLRTLRRSDSVPSYSPSPIFLPTDHCPLACPEQAAVTAHYPRKTFPYLVTSLPPYFLFSKSFSCNTYGSPRKCCKQKTYALAKPFRCNTYKKHAVGVFVPFWNLPPSLHFPFFSHTYVEPILQPLCFDGLPSNGGWAGIDNENSQERSLSRGSIETEEPLLFSNEDSCPQQHRDEAISVPRASEHGTRITILLRSLLRYFLTSSPAACLIASGNGEPPDER